MKARVTTLAGFVGLALLTAGNLAVTSTAQAATFLGADLDRDTDVDQTDFGLLSACLSGANVPRAGTPACQDADIDYDGDVDLSDFGTLQRCLSGPGQPGDPTCGCVRPEVNRTVGATANPVNPGGSTNITVAASQVGVNYQLRNDADDSPVGSPVAGTGGLIWLPTGPVAAMTTFNVFAINAALGCPAQLTHTQTIFVPTRGNINRIGVHVVIGSRNGYGPFIQDTAEAGKPVALVKCVDDFGAADEPHQYSPDTLTIGRKNDTPNYDLQGFDAAAEQGIDPAVFAQTIFNELHPTWDANPQIDVWEICNEWSWWWAWQTDFYIAMMNIAEAHNPPYRIALYGCSVGNPPEDYWPEIARACARAKAHGNHILSLHEYALWTDLLQDSNAQYGDDLVLRYRRLYNYLATENAVIPLALTEVGQGGGGSFVGTQLFVQDFGWYDAQLRQDDYVIGCAAWTLGNWAGANFQDALPALANYIITH